MASRWQRIFVILLISMVWWSSPALAAELNVLWPPNKFLTVAPSVRLIVEIAGSKTDAVRLQVNQGNPVTVPLSDKALTETYMGMFHKILLLKKGENTVKLEALAGGKVLEEKKLLVVSKNIRQKDVEVPAGFVNKRFHISAESKVCETCHQLQPQEADIKPFPVSKSSCYVCHNDKTKVIYLHGPVGTFQCLSCHNPKDPQEKYKTIARDAELCYTCHDNKEKEFKKKYLHGPLGTGKCDLCHDPHGSNYPYWLFARINDVCFSCHGVGFKFHPVTGHPTDIVRDPRRKGKTMSCVSCHDPHASNNPKLLSLAPDFLGTCNRCHRK